MLRATILYTFILVSSYSFGSRYEYVYGNGNFAEISKLPDSSWSEMGEQLYQGYKNGSYWVRLKKIGKHLHSMIRLNESHVKSAYLYRANGKKINPIPKTRKISFELRNWYDSEPLYLHVIFNKEAILSIEQSEINSFYRNEIGSNTGLGIYYGLVLIVALINIFSYFFFRRIAFIYYVIMLISIAMGLAISDGYLYLMTNNMFLSTYLEPFLNLCVSLILPVLANSYMPIKSFIPKLNRFGITFAIIDIALFLAYIITGDFYIFCWNQLIALLLVTIYWFGGLLLFRKNLEAKVFTIAYFIICFSCYDFYVARSFGFSLIGLSLNEFRVGAIIEMLVFTFAIGYQSKLLFLQNEKMRSELASYSQSIKTGPELESEMISKFNLTLREICVLNLIMNGKINKEIADELNVSVNTIKFHTKNIYQKLETSTRQETMKKYFSINKY